MKKVQFLREGGGVVSRKDHNAKIFPKLAAANCFTSFKTLKKRNCFKFWIQPLWY